MKSSQSNRTANSNGHLHHTSNQNAILTSSQNGMCNQCFLHQQSSNCIEAQQTKPLAGDTDDSYTLAQQLQQQHLQDQPGVGVSQSTSAGVQDCPLLAGQLKGHHIDVCEPNCSHSLEPGWCHMPVEVPEIDWSLVFDADVAYVPGSTGASGYRKYILPEGLQIHVADSEQGVAVALQQLRASMKDSVIAIDLEWRPDFVKGSSNPVAMIQLANSTEAVLIRTCRLHYKLPAVLQAFLTDDNVCMLGCSWGTCDEGKMQNTFAIGRQAFGRFLDLQHVGQGLGYNRAGLAGLAQHVLGLQMPKSKKVSMSNWEGTTLTPQQVKYAALDVLLPGQVFRTLRQWHASPQPCMVCRYMLGSTGNGSMTITCTCTKTFGMAVKPYLKHCETEGHEVRWADCPSCGRIGQLPWPAV